MPFPNTSSALNNPPSSGTETVLWELQGVGTLYAVNERRPSNEGQKVRS